MMKVPLADALAQVHRRNAAIAAAYRAWEKRLPPGPVSKLAASLAEQRSDLGKTIGEIAAKPFPREAEAELEQELGSLPGVEPPGPGLPPGAGAAGPADFLARVAAAETAEYELLAALAGSVIAFSGDEAERLAAEANSARKRSKWAQDHLDLLSMG
jgi:hypothetical protein